MALTAVIHGRPSVTYFDVADKANIQTAYDAIAVGEALYLTPGEDYTGVAGLTLATGKSIIAGLNTLVPPLTVPNGATDIQVWLYGEHGVAQSAITFASGGTFSDIFIHGHRGTITCTNPSMTNCHFENCANILIDASSSGYVRQCKFSGATAQSTALHFKLLGNTSTPCYGNLVTFFASLTPSDKGVQLDDAGDVVFVGANCESWPDTAGKYGFDIQGETSVYFVGLGGGGGDHAAVYLANGVDNAVFCASGIDAAADSAYLFDAVESIADFDLDGRSGNPGIDDNNVPATNLRAAVGRFSDSPNATIINGTNVTSSLPSSTLQTMLRSLLMTERTVFQIQLPTYRKAPDPFPLWSSNLNDPQDDTDTLQGYIDNGTEHIAFSKPVYFISSALQITTETYLQFAGSRNVCIVQKTQGANIFEIDDASNVKFSLKGVTLYGGTSAIYLDTASCAWAYGYIDDVCFDGQSANVVHCNSAQGVDNCRFNNCHFVASPCVLRNAGDGVDGTLGYFDKVRFWQCQFDACGSLVEFANTRSNNLNVFEQCWIEGCSTRIGTFKNSLQNGFFACRLIDNSGNPAIDANNTRHSFMVACKLSGTHTGLSDGTLVVADCILDSTGNVMTSTNPGWLLNCTGTMLPNLTNGAVVNSSLTGYTEELSSVTTSSKTSVMTATASTVSLFAEPV